jgi:palmitoyltransferase
MSLSFDWLSVVCVLWICTYFYTFALYAVASFSDPGYINIMWLEDVRQDLGFKEVLDDFGEKPFCETCSMPRPIRTHHCSVCKKCVLLMDHHCDFIGNCVGYRNYRAIFMFMVIFMIHTGFTIAILTFGLVQPDLRPPQAILFIFGTLYFGLFGSLIVCQLCAQIKFLLTNSTWIEMDKKQVRKAIYERSKVKYHSRFDIGIWRNLKQRLGENPLLWLIPMPNYGRAYCFPENPKFVGVWELRFQSANDDDDEKGLLIGARLRDHVIP